jgi:putative heme degradation protein
VWAVTSITEFWVVDVPSNSADGMVETLERVAGVGGTVELVMGVAKWDN